MTNQSKVTERTARLAEIRDIVCDVFSAEPEVVETTTSFESDLEGDSLLVIELLTKLEKRFGITIDQSDMPRLVTDLPTVYEVVAESAGW
jgi:acyl carrier protein